MSRNQLKSFVSDESGSWTPSSRHLDGAMLHIVGDGVGDLADNGLIEIGAIRAEGHLYEGVSLSRSRTNFADATSYGTNRIFLDGTHYFPENHLDLGGTGIAVGNQLIAHTLYIHGTGTFTIDYDGRSCGRTCQIL